MLSAKGRVKPDWVMVGNGEQQVQEIANQKRNSSLISRHAQILSRFSLSPLQTLRCRSWSLAGQHFKLFTAQRVVVHEELFNLAK